MGEGQQPPKPDEVDQLMMGRSTVQEQVARPAVTDCLPERERGGGNSSTQARPQTSS